MIIAVVSYFALATLALAILFLPEARSQVTEWARRLVFVSVVLQRRALRVGQRSAEHAIQVLGGASAGGRAWIVDHHRPVAFIAVLLVASFLVPIALRGFIQLDAFDHRVSRETNEQVGALLQGEQLVPPPSIPPELFATREVEQAIPLIRGASRQWELLDAEFRQRLLATFRLMRDQHGYEMVLLEGYRGAERQAQLAALGPRVTRAGPFESLHQYGLAADCAFIRDGRIVVSEQDPWAAAGYALYGAVARSTGLEWGGGWRTLKDLGHVELGRAGMLQRRSEAQG